jgi:hypothetical protein
VLRPAFPVSGALVVDPVREQALADQSAAWDEGQGTLHLRFAARSLLVLRFLR